MVIPTTNKENITKASVKKKIIKQIKLQEKNTVSNANKKQDVHKTFAEEIDKDSNKNKSQYQPQSQDERLTFTKNFQEPTTSQLREAFMWSEILGKPVSRRRRR